VGCAACISEIRNTYKILVGKSERKIQFAELRRDERIGFKWILEEQDVTM
jgi:hypothetical protein